MKKYLLIILPAIAYILIDLFQVKKGYTNSDRIANLEKAREAKLAKSLMKKEVEPEPEIPAPKQD